MGYLLVAVLGYVIWRLVQLGRRSSRQQAELERLRQNLRIEHAVDVDYVELPPDRPLPQPDMADHPEDRPVERDEQRRPPSRPRRYDAPPQPWAHDRRGAGSPPDDDERRNPRR